MKTVIDAVNEFKGEWEEDLEQLEDEHLMVESFGLNPDFPSEKTGFISRGYTGFNDEMYRAVCTHEEFNQCVKEMETNFGESEGYSNYILEFNSGDKVSCYVCHVGAFPMQQYCGSCGHELLSELIPEPKPSQATSGSDNSKPVYSQQKSVLMEESLKCIIDHLSEYGVCGVNEMVHDNYHVASVDELYSPQQKAKWVALNALDRLNIKPPIELIDGKAYQFDCEIDGRDVIGICEHKKGLTMINTLKGTSHNAEFCTNIQLLEVKS